MADDNVSCHVRAEAAERTVAVLKRRLRAIDGGEEKTVIQRQFESAQRRAAETVRRRELSELRSAELQRYSRILEDEVAARTEQIRTILDHVSAGLLLIGPNFCVQPGWSRSCEVLLGTKLLEHRPLPELLAWSPGQTVEFELMTTQVFDDILPEELTTWQIPRRASLAGREIQLAFSAVRHDGVVMRLLATIIDVTAQIAAEHAARCHERLVNILTQRTAFQAYIGDARRVLLEAAEAAVEQDTAFVRRAVHTVKGNSATFGLDEVVAVCHDVESAPTIAVEGISRIASALRTFLEQNRKVLGLDPDAAILQTYTLTQAELDTLANKARAKDAHELDRFVARLRQRPANDFIGPIRAAVSRLSERLQKEVDFEVRGGDLPIDPVRLGPVLQCLPHLVRNAVDHGIEPSDERGSKPRRGRVVLSFRDDGETWEIDLSDDGRGIDPVRVYEAAVRQGFVDPLGTNQLTPINALPLISADGFSTATAVTDVSGRGVGLSAVREAVRTVSGQLELDSELGHGARFRIRVPKQDQAA